MHHNLVHGTGGSPLRGLANLRHCRSRRVSSYDRRGGNRDFIRIPAGKTATLADIKGAGCIDHIWFTIACGDKHYLRKLLLRAYWDGEERPSIDTPVGDFFGAGHAELKHYTSLPLAIIGRDPGGPRGGMNCWFPMPFARRARLEIVNDSDQRVNAFYYYVDYEEYDELGDGVARFHAKWRRVNPCRGRDVSYAQLDKLNRSPNLTGKDNYVILDARGKGHYVGCNLQIDNVDALPRWSWFGEGDDMIFIDGEGWPPSLHGTGTEDYFCAAWGFPAGEYAGPYCGITMGADKEHVSGKWCVYRFHIEDPICFQKSIRVTIEHGHDNWERNDYASTAYWYQAEPHKAWSPMPPVETRLPIHDTDSRMSWARTVAR